MDTDGFSWPGLAFLVILFLAVAYGSAWCSQDETDQQEANEARYQYYR